MSTVDPSIALSGNTQGFNVGNALQLAETMQVMQARKAQMQKQNALAAVLGNPQSYGPDGQVNQNALRGVMSLNPEVGMKLHEDNIAEQLKKAQERHYESESGKLIFDHTSGIAGVAYDAYEASKAAGGNEQKARDDALKARNAAVDASGGVLSMDQIKAIKGTPWDPVQSKAFASMNPEWQKNKKEQDTREHQLAQEATAQKNEETRLAQEKAYQRHLVAEDAHHDRQDALATTKALGGKLGEKASDLRASLAEMGVEFPSGMRSIKAQNDLLESLVRKHPDMAPDDIAKLVRSGKINMKTETTEASVLGRREAAILPVEKSITKPGGFLDQAEAAVNAVDFPKLKAAGAFEKWGKDQESDPNLTAYKAAVAELRAEYSIVLSKGGQVTDAARHEAEKVIPDLITKEQFKKIKKTVQQGIEASKGGVEESIEGVAGGKKENANNTIHWDDLK